jgi:glyoxylate reductase
MAQLRAGVQVTTRSSDAPPTEAELLALVPGHDAVLCQLTSPVTRAVLEAGAVQGLQLVSQVAVGLDNIDLEACAALGISVAHTPGVLTDATADLTLALLLAAARRLPEAQRFLRQGRWDVWSLDLMAGLELRGAVLGIVGLGRIGQAVATRARAFGMRIIYSSPRRAGPDVEADLGAEWLALDALLAQADIISLHAPLASGTRHLLSRERLGMVKSGAILINTARGGLIDESALADALDSGPLGFAALDVFENEPRIDSALMGREDVLLVPHIGSATRATRLRMAQLATDAVLDWAAGRPLAHAALGATVRAEG